MILGLAVMIVSEAATLAHIEPFWSWNTPIAWTGFILFADSVVFTRRGGSWLRTSPREFVFLAAVSIPLWLVFELYNLFIQNWYYTGLPRSFALRMFGYVWAFATIWPAIFEGADLVSVLRGKAAPSASVATPPGTGPRGLAALSMAFGAVCLVAPFVVSPRAAGYLAAPVWLGFIFLLDPINRRLGAPSILGDFARRDLSRVVNLTVSGFLCGFLWEFWNYWSRSKWHYTVPFLSQIKLFEMPLPGFLGFPAFALECFTMYVFVRAALGLRGRAIAL